MAQEGALHSFTNCVPKLALIKCPKPAKCLIQRELTIGIIQQLLVIELCPCHLQFFLHHLNHLLFQMSSWLKVLHTQLDASDFGGMVYARKSFICMAGMEREVPF